MIGIKAFNGDTYYFPFQHTLESQDQLLERLQAEANIKALFDYPPHEHWECYSEEPDYEVMRGAQHVVCFGGYMAEKTTEDYLTLMKFDRAGMRRS